MKRLVIFFVILASIFLSQSVFASIVLINSSISSQYSPNSTINGWIDVNISNEMANSSFSTNLNQNIPLISFIRAQNFSPTSNYICSPANCNYSYVTTNSLVPTSLVHLNTGQSMVFGINITGNITSINSFSLNVTSNAPELNESQLSIDLLNDNNIEWNQYKGAQDLANVKYYGCYNSSLGSSASYSIYSTNYCEEVYLSRSPMINIGADISGSGVSNLTLSIYDSNFNQLGMCKEPADSSGEIGCIAQDNTGNSFPIIGGYYYVCIKTDASNSSDQYLIGSQSQSPLCGFYGNNVPLTGYTANYAIFAQPGNFAPIGSFILNNTEAENSKYNGNPLETEISNYISSQYGNNCQSGCVIPIKFSSNISQDLNLSDFNLSITTSRGIVILHNLYNVSTASPTYSTNGIQNFSLNYANFAVPNAFGSNNFVLNFNNNTGSYTLLSSPINILQISQILSINPTITTALSPTNFVINMNAFGANVTSYQWNFGDGKGIETTLTNNATYSYNQLGNFSLQITVTNSLNLTSSANFTIQVVSPKSAVNQLLILDTNDLKSLQSQMGSFPSFARTILNKTLNLANISNQLQDLTAANNSASSDSEYITIMSQLESINLPNSIQQTQSALVPFFQTNSTIDLDALKGIGGGTYDPNQQDDYINAIIASDLGNVSTSVSYGEFSAVYGSTVSPVLDTVQLNVNGPSGYYLAVPSNLDNIKFDNIYQQSGNYYYLPLTGNPQTISFATTETLSPNALPIFIAPSLTSISLSPASVKMGVNKYLVLALIIAGIIFVIVIVVFALIRWYRFRYESYLFKDRNDLYNIINYINSSKTKGLKNREIEKNLRKSRWSSEQVDYVMKIYAKKK
ncbi:MAG: PKD domain-containing protein [Candidatus Nanoarchaeia archaeon]